MVCILLSLVHFTTAVCCKTNFFTSIIDNFTLCSSRHILRQQDNRQRKFSAVVVPKKVLLLHSYIPRKFLVEFYNFIKIEVCVKFGFRLHKRKRCIKIIHTLRAVNKATDLVFHTDRVCHVWCNFLPSYTCRTTIIFGTPKESSLEIDSLPLNDCFSCMERLTIAATLRKNN